MTAKAYLIDPVQRTVSDVKYDDSGIADIRRLLGLEEHESFSLGAMVGQGDPLYVNDDGMRRPLAHFFQLAGPHGFDDGVQPIGGLALVVGRDKPDRGDEPDGSMDPATPRSEVAMKLRWMSRHQADAWSVRRFNLPAVTVNGEVLRTWEQEWRTIPEPAGLSPVHLIVRSKAGVPPPVICHTVWEAVDRARIINQRQLLFQAIGVTTRDGIPLLSQQDLAAVAPKTGGV